MSGKRVADRVGRRPLTDFIRIACSTDPVEPVRRPRRLALAPRAAIGVGIVLVTLALALALCTVLTAPTPLTGAAATAAPDDATAVATVPVTDPLATAAPTGGETSGEIVVHVAGAVASPGVVMLPTGARVIDALNAAGGALSDADTDQLNLARTLTDGEQVRVPHQGEDTSTWQTDAGTGEAVAGSGGTEGGGSAAADGRVNINTATAAELEALPGIGPALAQRIVDYRADHGPFTSVDELTNVSGIGTAKLEALRDEATV